MRYCIFFRPSARREMLAGQGLPGVLMTGFRRSEVAEQRTRAGVRGPLRGARIEVSRLPLHSRRFVPDPLRPRFRMSQTGWRL